MLFTTHQMDEADILADRKAVLSHGRLQCLGSSLFLKSRFGVGYTLNIVRKQQQLGGAPIDGTVGSKGARALTELVQR
jgi:ABC-type multidrug transport system ATPase subunit